MPLCACGCGQEVNWYQGKPYRFVYGHQARGCHNPMWGKKSVFEHHSEATKCKISKALKGREVSEEHRRKISQTRKARIKAGVIQVTCGKKHSEESKRKMSESHRGERNYLWGKHLPKEWRRKISEANKGSRAYNWRGGSSFQGYDSGFNRELKQAVREKDGFICQICGGRENGKHHHCHHIDYNKKNNAMDNLITLCQPCHSLTGMRRSYWQTVFEMRRGIRLLPDLKVVAR